MTFGIFFYVEYATEFLRERVITITKGFYYWAIRMVQHENQLGNITKKNAILRNKLNQGS